MTTNIKEHQKGIQRNYDIHAKEGKGKEVSKAGEKVDETKKSAIEKRCKDSSIQQEAAEDFDAAAVEAKLQAAVE